MSFAPVTDAWRSESIREGASGAHRVAGIDSAGTAPSRGAVGSETKPNLGPAQTAVAFKARPLELYRLKHLRRIVPGAVDHTAHAPAVEGA